MIASLRGTILDKTGQRVIVDVNGVGYGVAVKKRFLESHGMGDTVALFIHTAVSENDICLYGFELRDELEVFNLLISVSGVGPKTALQVMAEKNFEEIIKAIGGADVEFFQKIKGIGKKTAQRIIVDLKSKIGGLGELDLTQNEAAESDDLYLSLKQLGFVKSEIEKVVAKVPKEVVEIEQRIQWCLQNLG